MLAALLTVGMIVASCGGSDDKKDGLLSGLNKDANPSNQSTGGSGNQDPRTAATALAQLGGTVPNLPNGQGLTQDPKALATTIAQLSSGTGIPNLQGPSQDPRALATAVAPLTNSSQVPQGNSAATPDPCTLISLDDAAALLKSKDVRKGKDVGSPNNPLGSRECSYETQGMNFASISLTVISTAGVAPQMKSAGFTAKRQFEELKKLTKSPVDVKGIGDDAFTDGRFIHVLKKDVTFDLLVFTDGDATDTLKAAATRVAGKLP
jgi:hypothetical protein